jgi:hypothetical protein
MFKPQSNVTPFGVYRWIWDDVMLYQCHPFGILLLIRVYY